MAKQLTQYITLLGEKLILKHGFYANNRTAYQLISEYGEPFMKLTVNIPEEKLEPGEFFVKTWAENEPYIADILGSGIFTDTGKRVQCGDFGCMAAVWRLAK